MTMRSNKAIVNAAGQTITTAGLAAGGALNPEQAKKFIQQTFEATPLSGLVRHELRSAKTGEIDKIGVGRRLLRKKDREHRRRLPLRREARQAGIRLHPCPSAVGNH